MRSLLHNDTMSKLLLVLIAVSCAVLIQWLFFRGTRVRPPTENSDSSVRFDPDKLRRPSTIEEIRSVVKEAREGRKKIRVVGAGHSWSPIAYSEDIQISLDLFSGIVSIEEDQLLATVKGGTTIDELNRALASRGLAVPYLPSVDTITLVGAISTGTHGSAIGQGNLAALLVKMKIMTSSGQVLTLSPSSDPELFQAAAVSIGLLGIVVEVTIRCEPAFNLRESLTIYSIDHCLEHLRHLSQGEFVKLWLDVNSQLCHVFTSNKTLESPRNNLAEPFTSIQFHLFELVQWLTSMFPSITRPVMDFIYTNHLLFYPYDRVDVSTGVFHPPFHLAPVQNAEIAVADSDCASAIHLLSTFVDEHQIAANFFVEVRFVKGDDFWLSPDYERDSCHLTYLLYNPSERDYNLYFLNYTQLIRQNYRGRSHWGKIFHLTPTEFRDLYPRSEEFLEVQRKMDPDGMFVNRALKLALGI